MRRYVPERGDTAWLDLPPQAGHEQSGRRPVLVLSPRRYNERTGMAIVCPLTSNVKGYPFEVPSSIGGREGAVLADHVRSIDWVARRARRINRAPTAIVDRVAALIASLISA